MNSCCFRWGARWLAAVVFAVGTAHAQSTDGPPAAAIASAHPLATRAGFEILDQGGNAFDAAVAVAAALGVVEPQSSGFGGGGFWLLHRASDGHEIMVDGREAAPAAAHRDMYLDENGNPDRNASLRGPLAAGIPGFVAGIAYINEHFGQLDLATCLAPAIRLARDGFEVTETFHQLLTFSRARLADDPGAAQVFYPGGEVPPVGTLLRQPGLANTLEQIARNGADAFYRGSIAQNLVAGVQAVGGNWTLDDFAAYQARARQPVVGSYRDIRIVSAAPPSSGGVVLLQTLNVLENFDLGNMAPALKYHLVIEAMRHAYRDRAIFLGDADFVDVPVARLINKDYARERLAAISLSRATPMESFTTLSEAREEGTDTSHFSVIDRQGNRVGGTQSINTGFGAGVLEPVTGILLNNEMDDFALPDLTPNAYGLVGTSANEVEPGKRPLSSMSPTFVETDNLVGILGTPGGSRIISMVLLGILDFANGGDADSMVSTPRYHHQFIPDAVEFETGAFSEAEQEFLAARGHVVREARRRYGDMQAIVWNRSTGAVTAASDPRGEGEAQVR